MRSLIADMSYCYVCGRVGRLETHHCFHGSANRKLADDDKMVVALCPCCHRGYKGVHNNAELDRQIKQDAQKVWQAYYGKTVEEFRERYGRSFL